MPALPLSVGGLLSLQTVEPLHVFAFGSLLHTHTTLAHFREPSRCCVKGHRRAFNLASPTKRGSQEVPGRVVNLCRAAAETETWGIALRCPPPGPDRELALRFVWSQEEEYDEALTLPLFLEDGLRQDHWPAVPFVAVPSVETPFVEHALVLVGSEQSTNWADEMAIAETTSVVGAASGELGRNDDYVFDLGEALRAHCLQDQEFFKVEGFLRRRRAAASGNPLHVSGFDAETGERV